MTFSVVVVILMVELFSQAVEGQLTSSSPPLSSSSVANSSDLSVVNEIRIGYLSDEQAPPYRWGAINLALRQGQKDGLLPGYSFKIVYNVTTDSCDVKSAMFETMYMLEKKSVDVLFGIPCSPICIANGYVTSYYNIPHFPNYCGDSSLDNKKIYNTMVRIAGSWKGLAQAFADILQTYGWRRLVLLTDTTSSPCYFGGAAIAAQISSWPNSSFNWILMELSPTDNDINDYLNQVKGRSRIVIYCHNTPAVMQQLLFAAQDKNMTSGDYVFFTFSPDVSENQSAPWNAYDFVGEDFNYRRKAFYAVKQIFGGKNQTQSGRGRITLDSSHPFGQQRAEHHQFHARSCVSVFRSALVRQLHWNGALSPSSRYDSVYLYMIIADKMLRNGYSAADIANGTLVFQQAISTQFSGVTGRGLIDSNGDRLSIYAVWTLEPGHNQYYRYMQIDLTNPNIHGLQAVSVYAPVTWASFGSVVPPDEPPCGFADEFCPPPNHSLRIIIGCSVGGAVLLVIIIAAQVTRSRRNEAKIQQMLWKIDCRELVYSSRTASAFSKLLGSRIRDSMLSETLDDNLANSFLTSKRKIATYRGNAVAVYPVAKAELNLTRPDLIALINLKELSHDNVKTFVGACIEPGHICYVMNLCTRGTIQDVIEDENIKLDWLFRLSLISDLINGMRYIHSSMFHFHGQLTSAQCNVDSRWVLKIGGFGLDAFHGTSDIKQDDHHAYYWELLWTAPELLRMKQHPINGTQKGDVYSFAIIVQEIAYRAQPYFCDSIDPKTVIEKVSADSTPYYRPTVTDEDPEMPLALLTMMNQCWSELPSERPSFDEVSKMFRQINKGRNVDIVDNMLQKLESYANNLEELVHHRTCELEEEKRKTDILLYRMLPRFIAEELKSGHSVMPQMYPSATIYFSDIVGFTTLSSSSTPMEVVELLNDLYSAFDDTISRHDVYKVETIGDAYMVVSGLPKPNEGRHIREICDMALNLLEEVNHFIIRHRPGEKLKLRIGIHTGPCAAGVVGHAMPRYCLFGDTVNVASRMESTGEALKIHVSESAHKAIAPYEEYVTEPRGETFVKGKGMLPTFWLLGRKSCSSGDKDFTRD